MRPPVGEILDAFTYDPTSGELRNKVRRNRVRAGALAGTVSCGRRQVCFKKRMYRSYILAWVIMTGRWPDDQIDHVNRNSLDDCWNNLRACNNSQNGGNKLPRRDSKSGIKGVRYVARRRQWQARIQHTHLGWFPTKEQATAAYGAAAVDRFGEFACLIRVSE